MEKKPRDRNRNARAPLTPEEQRELEAKKKLARPPKDKTEVTIGPSDKIGPDVTFD
jgi:hypothetical protein